MSNNNIMYQGQSIRVSPLEGGLVELCFDHQGEASRLTPEKSDAVLASIRPQLDYAGFDQVDVVIEAAVENIKIKHLVLPEVEAKVRHDTVIASKGQ